MMILFFNLCVLPKSSFLPREGGKKEERLQKSGCHFATRIDMVKKAQSGCGGFDEGGPRRLIHWSAPFPVSGAVWEALGMWPCCRRSVVGGGL